jgi:hypothetical protein
MVLKLAGVNHPSSNSFETNYQFSPDSGTNQKNKTKENNEKFNNM